GSRGGRRARPARCGHVPRTAPDRAPRTWSRRARPPPRGLGFTKRITEATVATRGTEALLARLSRLNRTTVFLVAIAVVLAGLLLPAPYGGVLLVLVTA